MSNTNKVPNAKTNIPSKELQHLHSLRMNAINAVESYNHFVRIYQDKNKSSFEGAKGFQIRELSIDLV